MDKLKQWLALTVVAVLAVAAAGWFLLVAPKRAEAAELREQADAQLSANGLLAQQLAVLKAQAKDLPQQQAKLATVTAKIPADPSLPALIRALTTASTTTGVEFVSLVPGPPAAAAVAAPVGTVADAGTDPSSTPAPSSAGTAAPSTGPGGTLSVIPVTITVVGGFYELQQYLDALEGLPRALRVNNLTLTPGLSPVADTTGAGNDVKAKDGSSLVSVIVGEVFLSVGSEPVVAAGVPGASVPGAPVPGAPGAPSAPGAPGAPGASAGPAAATTAPTVAPPPGTSELPAN